MSSLMCASFVSAWLLSAAGQRWCQEAIQCHPCGCWWGLSIFGMQGDVYHILFNLGEWLDGRVWPRKDQLEVLRLMDLIHHVTGVPQDWESCDTMQPFSCIAGLLEGLL